MIHLLATNYNVYSWRFHHCLSARKLTHYCRCHDISCANKLEECPYKFYLIMMMNELTQEIHDDD